MACSRLQKLREESRIIANMSLDLSLNSINQDKYILRPIVCV